MDIEHSTQTQNLLKSSYHFTDTKNWCRSFVNIQKQPSCRLWKQNIRCCNWNEKYRWNKLWIESIQLTRCSDLETICSDLSSASGTSSEEEQFQHKIAPIRQEWKSPLKPNKRNRREAEPRETYSSWQCYLNKNKRKREGEKVHAISFIVKILVF